MTARRLEWYHSLFHNLPLGVKRKIRTLDGKMTISKPFRGTGISLFTFQLSQNTLKREKEQF